MKKEDLIKLGLDETMAQKVADSSAEELKSYIPKARFDEVNNDKKKLELDVRDRDSQLETLKNSTGDVEALKQQIVTLQADNKAKDEAHAAEVKKMQIDRAVENALTGAKAKNMKAVKALLDLEKAELDGDSIKGLDDQLKKLQESEDSKFLFESSKPTNPKFKGINPGENHDGAPGAENKPSSLADAVRIHFENNKE